MVEKLSQLGVASQTVPRVRQERQTLRRHLQSEAGTWPDAAELDVLYGREEHREGDRGGQARRRRSRHAADGGARR